MTIERSEETKRLDAAILLAQREKLIAEFDSLNEVARGFKVPYASFNSVWDTIREKVLPLGIAVIQYADSDPLTDSVTVYTELAHAESGEWRRSSVSCRPVDFSPQKVGGAITYLKRYAVCAMLGIIADKDDDGASNVAGAAAQAQPQRQADNRAPAAPARQSAAAPANAAPRPASAPKVGWKCEPGQQEAFARLLRRARAAGMNDGQVKTELMRSGAFATADWTAYGAELMARAILEIEEVVSAAEERLASAEG